MFQTKKDSKKKENLRVLVVSDTHQFINILDRIQKQEEGDIFIHAGDFTDYGQQKYFHYFFDFLDKLRFKHKIVISGNHEISLDNNFIKPKDKIQYLDKFPCSLTRDEIIHNLKKRCHYLQHQSINIQGLNIFGSPLTPYFVGNAFQYDEVYEKDIWYSIPENTDILITHCPPHRILDSNFRKIPCGSKHLQKVSLQIKPKYHIFGHIHQSRGLKKINDTVYINAAMNPTKFLI